MDTAHKAGFVSIVGKPNVGKSTLMNRLVGENLSIITSKVQTTRHRIMGIISGDHFQIVYSDTPGMLQPCYALQQAMMNYVNASLEDADLILAVVDDNREKNNDLATYFRSNQCLVIVVLNKIDLLSPSQLEQEMNYWKTQLNPVSIIPISALKNQHIDILFHELVKKLPEHPAYYSKDELTTRSRRFFASEIVREKIFMYYNREIPYSVEVVVEAFKEEETIIRLRVLLYVERQSQKSILIGKGGRSLKKVGISARHDLEAFFDKKIFLETYVKVLKNWRKERINLERFGYKI